MAARRACACGRSQCAISACAGSHTRTPTSAQCVPCRAGTCGRSQRAISACAGSHTGKPTSIQCGLSRERPSPDPKAAARACGSASDGAKSQDGSAEKECTKAPATAATLLSLTGASHRRDAYPLRRSGQCHTIRPGHNSSLSRYAGQTETGRTYEVVRCARARASDRNRRRRIQSLGRRVHRLACCIPSSREAQATTMAIARLPSRASHSPATREGPSTSGLAKPTYGAAAEPERHLVAQPRPAV